MRLCLVLLYCCCSFGLAAQSLRAYERAAQEAYAEGDFYTAKQRYETVLKAKRKDAGLYFRYAEACRQVYAYSQAIEAYEKVLELEEQGAYADFYYYYAQSLKHQGRYEEADQALIRYLQENSSSAFLRRKAEQERKACRLAPELLANPVQLKIEQLGDSINSPYSEFAPHWVGVGGQLYLSSLRYERRGGSLREKIGQPKVYISKVVRYEPSEQKLQPLPYINKANVHTANSTYCAATRELFFTRCTAEEGDSLQCSLYRSEWVGMAWGSPELLAEPLNLPNTSNTQPSVYWEEEKKQLHLWFVSDRAGGQGHTDIWYSSRQGERGNPFSTPVALPAGVNSEGYEATPFWLEEEQRLYFSSTWHAGLGGYDVFYVEKKGEDWTEPVNVGPPINSAANDLYFIRRDTLGYISSNRQGSQTLTEEACCNDIYRLQWPRPVVPDTPLLVQVDTPDLKVPEPPNPRPLERLQEMLPISLYFHNDEPDSNSRATQASVPYARAYQSYMLQVPNYARAHLEHLAAQEAVNKFLEEQVGGEYQRLTVFLEGVQEVLDNEGQLQLQIRGFTSPKAPTAYNEALAQRRISSVEKELRAYRGGVFIPYLESGQLKISRTAFGERRVPDGVSDSARDLRRSVYSVEAAQERRVEIEAVLEQPQ